MLISGLKGLKVYEAHDFVGIICHLSFFKSLFLATVVYSLISRLVPKFQLDTSECSFTVTRITKIICNIDL